ncbi:hypothetical protein ONS96_004840 [Cadophora gregata f. sp. sojae]|nr:hypothetical protein ONS96_004840 [Cadophora gregata f. sp. sojae]
MMSSSTHSSSDSSSHSGSSYLDSSHSDSLLQLENIIEEHSKDTLSYSADALLHLVDAPSSPFCENTQLHMPPQNRSAGRDVHIFDIHNRSTSIGGLILTASITNANLYSMIQIIVFFDGEYILRNESGIIIERDDSLLLRGNYYIDSPHPFVVNNEAVLVRTVSSSHSGPRVHAFRDAVRLRDGRCIITGVVALGAQYDNWRSFEAAHIFPLAYEEHWRNNDYARWISLSLNVGGSINSVQNGLLLRSNMHDLFDSYEFSINPDDSYKIVHFSFDYDGIAGKHLDQRFLDDPQRPPDELFRWHFRQAVLANMRGAGEPRFEHDFPPRSDIVGSILEGPKAAERMEFELFNRLATEVDLTQ